MVSEDKINEAVRRIVEGFHPVRVILFGSHARGTADEMSDVDLLILHPLDGSMTRRQLTTAMDNALYGLSLPRDIVVMTPEEFESERDIPGTVARPAWLQGKVLYDCAA